MTDELETFLNTWDTEAKKTAAVIRLLPTDSYDFRPDPGGRSLGELAWHLAELEGYTTYGIEQSKFSFGMRPPGIERPKSLEAMAAGYEQVHTQAVQRVRHLVPADLDRKIRHFTGNEMSVRELLWAAVLFHGIHHRGQLSILCRLAGGPVPEIFGPNREEMARLRAQA